ncbi:hypothetical protein L195_g056970, partial [Trifolium pratense]
MAEPVCFLNRHGVDFRFLALDFVEFLVMDVCSKGLDFVVGMPCVSFIMAIVACWCRIFVVASCWCEDLLPCWRSGSLAGINSVGGSVHFLSR